MEHLKTKHIPHLNFSSLESTGAAGTVEYSEKFDGMAIKLHRTADELYISRLDKGGPAIHLDCTDIPAINLKNSFIRTYGLANLHLFGLYSLLSQKDVYLTLKRLMGIHDAIEFEWISKDTSNVIEYSKLYSLLVILRSLGGNANLPEQLAEEFHNKIITSGCSEPCKIIPAKRKTMQRTGYGLSQAVSFPSDYSDIMMPREGIVMYDKTGLVSAKMTWAYFNTLRTNIWYDRKKVTSLTSSDSLKYALIRGIGEILDSNIVEDDLDKRVIYTEIANAFLKVKKLQHNLSLIPQWINHFINLCGDTKIDSEINILVSYLLDQRTRLKSDVELYRYSWSTPVTVGEKTWYYNNRSKRHYERTMKVINQFEGVLEICKINSLARAKLIQRGFV